MNTCNDDWSIMSLLKWLSCTISPGKYNAIRFYVTWRFYFWYNIRKTRSNTPTQFCRANSKILSLTRMHSSRMRTTCTVTIRGGCLTQGGVWPRGCLTQGGVWLGGLLWGVPCDLSHHAFDVTCVLPPHQLRHINSAPAYILLPGHVTCKACWDTPLCIKTRL